MAGLPPPGGEERTASREEVCSAIAELTDAQLNRIHEYSKWQARALSAREYAISQEDLFQEALKRTLSGERQWDRKIRFDVHLIGVIRSIASHARERVSAVQVSWNPVARNEEGEDADGLATLSSNEASPERIAATGRFLAQLRERFEHDLDVQLVLDGLREGWTREEYNHHGLTKERHEAAMKRLRRHLRSAYPNGQTDVF